MKDCEPRIEKKRCLRLMKNGLNCPRNKDDCWYHPTKAKSYAKKQEKAGKGVVEEESEEEGDEDVYEEEEGDEDVQEEEEGVEEEQVKEDEGVEAQQQEGRE